jgi:hypothetical protein
LVQELSDQVGEAALVQDCKHALNSVLQIARQCQSDGEAVNAEVLRTQMQRVMALAEAALTGLADSDSASGAGDGTCHRARRADFYQPLTS